MNVQSAVPHVTVPDRTKYIRGLNVILDTLTEAFQGEHETELFDALEDTFYGPGRKKGERLHDYALRVQSNVRELAKKGVRKYRDFFCCVERT